jgi:hypothetical protein
MTTGRHYKDTKEQEWKGREVFALHLFHLLFAILLALLNFSESKDFETKPTNQEAWYAK